MKTETQKTKKINITISLTEKEYEQLIRLKQNQSLTTPEEAVIFCIRNTLNNT